MALVASGKRKLLNSNNNSPNSTPKTTKRSVQTISGLINSSEQSASLNTRSSKKSDLKDMKRVGSYAKSSHIKNNTEFMHKSKMLNSAASTTTSKFLSSKLRNNSSYTNGNNIANNSGKSIGKGSSPKSKKTIQNDTELRESANFSINTYSKENLEEQEAIHSKRLYEFKYQLEKLNEIKDSEMTDADLYISSLPIKFTNVDGAASKLPFFLKFIDQVNDLKSSSEENMSIVRNWYEAQKNEVSSQFNNELSRAMQEFQDKRKELKDSLRNENEDKKRQIEIDRQMLDINMESADSKPKPTRKLRRRTAGNNNNMNGGDFNVDSASSCFDPTASLHLASSVVSASSLLQTNSACSLNIVGHSSVPAALISTVCSVNGQYNASSLMPASSYFSSACLSVAQSVNNPVVSGVNERKKAKLAPITISFGLNEDDINEDLKQLI